MNGAKKKFAKKIQYKKHKIAKLLFSTGSIVFVIFFFAFIFFIHDLPDLNNLQSKGRRASVVFESYDGKTIANYGDLFRNVITVDSIPRHIWQAVLAIEDRRFFKHFGVDFIGISRALFTDIINKKIIQGGSTLTQQLAKNLFLSQARTIKRKIQEFVLAIWLEQKFTKKQILSIYLNRVYFGSGSFGIDAAAYRFFGKNTKNLTLYEAAKLASVLKSPISFSPLFNPDKSDDRTILVLSNMVEEGYISKNAMKEAILDRQQMVLRKIPIDENRYFTDWAMEQLQTIIGSDEEDLIIRTTLDTKLQKNAAQIIQNVLQEDGFKNGITQMALVSLDKNGAVRTMIGGYSYNASQFNRVLAQRASGSLFKYFIFLTALENKMKITDHIKDTTISIENWTPKNYHYTSVGSVSLNDAFVKSINTCAVRLSKQIGINKIIEKAEELGITSNIQKNYSSMLGSNGSTLLEMTASYGATMKDGFKMIPFGIISIKSQKGKILYRAYQKKKIKVIAKENCEQMKIMMKNLMQKGTGRRANLTSISCYGKTGTSNASRDASFIGFTDNLITGVWAGNDDNSPMNKKITGGTIPATVWNKFMKSAYTQKK